MDEQFSYEGLYRLLEERRAKRPEGSYTTYLFEKGLDKILKKVGEECTQSEGAPGAAKRLQGLRFICTGPTARRPRRWPPPR